MKIYIKCTEEMNGYRALLVKALRDAGHEVEYNALVRNDAAGQAGCDLHLELSAGGLHRGSSPVTPPPVSSAKKIDFRVQKLLLVIGHATLPRRAIVDGLHLKQKSRAVFINNYLKPAMTQGLVTMSCPAHPNLPEQMYRLTADGLDLYSALTKV